MTESSQDEQVVDPAAPEAPEATGEQDVPAPRPEAPGPESDSDSGSGSGLGSGSGNDTEVPVSEAAGDPLAEELAAEEEMEDDLAVAQRAVGELTNDLQRLQAEFVNYKRRVERDRELVRENATYAALAPIVEVLDTIDRAREHGEVDGGFQAVADQLERTVERLGLAKFGQPGDAFDPTFHEALSHIGEDPEVTVTTCKVIAKAGYRIGDRVVRAAQVLVVDPVSS